MKKILVIEDNAEVRENLEEILELSGYEVLTAEDGKLGVEIALKEMPDLVLCDVMMPRLDGFGESRRDIFELPRKTWGGSVLSNDNSHCWTIGVTREDFALFTG